MSMVLVYVTVPTHDQALAMSRRLVKERLVASANVLPGAMSFYRWEGKLEAQGETVVFLKTREELVDQVVAAVRLTHSYVCPCISALRIMGGNPEYLNWVAKETRQ